MKQFWHNEMNINIDIEMIQNEVIFAGNIAYESLQVRTPQIYEDIKSATTVHETENS